MNIKYISHGLFETGGYKLEVSLAQNLGNVEELRYRRNFKGILGWILLFIYALRDAGKNNVITVARLAWPAYLRILFNNRKLIVVIHNYDRSDGKPYMYYLLLNLFLKMASKKNKTIAIVTVAPFWVSYFKNNYNLSTNLYLYPNAFNTSKLRFYAEVVKKNSTLIHLGQFSDKIDKNSYHNLIFELRNMGYTCYFSSEMEVPNGDFPISVFNTHEAYLKQMSLSKATIILNRIHEGWNRVAHESFLTGTQVIAFPKGGLTDLVGLGGGYLVSDVQGVLDVLSCPVLKPINYEHLNDLDENKLDLYVEPIKNWLNAKQIKA